MKNGVAEGVAFDSHDTSVFYSLFQLATQTEKILKFSFKINCPLPAPSETRQSLVAKSLQSGSRSLNHQGKLARLGQGRQVPGKHFTGHRARFHLTINSSLLRECGGFTVV